MSETTPPDCNAYRRHSNGDGRERLRHPSGQSHRLSPLTRGHERDIVLPGALPAGPPSWNGRVVMEKESSCPARGIHRPSIFQNQLAAGIDPTTASFLDGSVAHNRPFQQAIRRSTAAGVRRSGSPPGYIDSRSRERRCRASQNDRLLLPHGTSEDGQLSRIYQVQAG